MIGNIRLKVLYVCFSLFLILSGCKIQVVTEPKEPKEKAEAESTSEAENIEREAMSGGLEYAILKNGDGLSLSRDMHLSIHYTAYLEDDMSVFDSSYDREEPISFILGRNMVIEGWEQILPELQVGDRARLWIPYEYAYGEEGRGPIPPRANLVFDIDILDAHDVIIPERYDVAYKDTVETESGLQVFIVEKGTGPEPARGDLLTVHYSGYLEDGSLFDSSVQRDIPLRFVLGTGQVLRGWDEGFLLLNKGARARMVVPPHLGYGDRGSGPIPPGSTLIFDVELIDINDR
jgi:peptidylprolyl isomerase